MSVAPCLFQSSHRRGAARASSGPPVISCKVETRDGKVYVHSPGSNRQPVPRKSPKNVIIVGGGAAVEMLRREEYSGGVTMISADDAIPYDRPALSKEFLNGTAGEKLIPLRSMDFYREHEIELLLNTRVSAIDLPGKRVQLADGSHRQF
ncbi:MAG: FAD-dependent oxidoreductase [Candidatus Acidiferrales bacterium]